ncbi:MAG: hypothetical protein J3K34DRAFT_443099 [Monoraphidium minutum]|nr:MAG: hypothetical protein J3K34DRAFT_443099 [Monoraphidium minutum]
MINAIFRGLKLYKRIHRPDKSRPVTQPASQAPRGLESKVAGMKQSAPAAGACPPQRAAAAIAAATLHSKRRVQAWLWGCYVVGVLSMYGYIALAVVPRPPPEMGFNWAPWRTAGIGVASMAHVLGLAMLMASGLVAFQELVWRRALDGSPNASERIFFASSLAARALFLATLALHHYGPGSQDAAAVGDARHRTFLFAAWYAAYAADLWQLLMRPKHFSRAFVGLMVPHHFVSLAWFGLWMVTLAPRDAGGAPIWNTAIIYLCGCIPNHTFKLWTTYHRPKWAGLLVGPATMCHWAILLMSQGYFFSQCTCSSWGCWFPGSVVMLVGAW